MRIAVVGGYGVGLTMRMDRAPEAGETVIGSQISYDPGGKGSNQAIAASRLGAHVSLLTAVGQDEHGREARNLWRAEGVNHDFVAESSKRTMSAFILVDSRGENRIAIDPGALDDLSVSNVDEFRLEIAAADMLVVSLEIPQHVAWHALKLAREVGTRTLLNPAPAKRIPQEVWRLVDFFTPNSTEAAVSLGLSASADPGTRVALVNKLQLRSGGTVVMTLGEQGVLVGGGTEVVATPAVRVDSVVDTTGAGDAFTAALAVYLCSGYGPIEAARRAQLAGAFAVTRPGVIPALPRIADLEAMSYLVGQI